MESVAVITGANSGIGLSLTQRLLSELPKRVQRICLACRDMEKAEAARRQLQREYPGAQVDLLQLDTSSPSSVRAAAAELRQRYQRINWLYCNAGIMPTKGIDLSVLCTMSVRRWSKIFSTGEGILAYGDWKTSEGLQAVFATNVFGHYLLISEMEGFLTNQGSPCHVIWTSSNSARTVDIDLCDIQDAKGLGCYPRSKKLMDIATLALNRRLNGRGLYFTSTCPGLVVSQMTLALFPTLVWYLLIPLLFLIRILITNFITYSPHNGSQVLVWLASQDAGIIDHSVKYFSRTSAFGKTYVIKEKMVIDDELVKGVARQLDGLVQQFTRE